MSKKTRDGDEPSDAHNMVCADCESDVERFFHAPGSPYYICPQHGMRHGDEVKEK